MQSSLLYGPCDSSSSSAVLHSTWSPYPSIWGRPEPRKIEVQRRQALWLGAVILSLGRLARLPDDWDRRGARAVNFDDVRDALVFLQRVMHDDTAAPSIGPLSSGGIELRWRTDGLEVEAIFDRRREETVLAVIAGSNETEEPIHSAEKLFADIADRLAAPAPDRA